MGEFHVNEKETKGINRVLRICAEIKQTYLAYCGPGVA
jgi:hypothetical protein